MKIVVAGGTGFIGGRLLNALGREGHEAGVLTRRPAGGARETLWDGETSGPWEKELDGADAVINLSGESVAGGRWTAGRKERLRKSRLRSTRALVEAMGRAGRRPAVLVNASAVGYYGPVADGDVTEEAGPGRDFLAGLCREWEAEAAKAEALGVRVVMMRLGVVLGREGGALPKMALPFRLFAGGPVGDGRQWVPWVHAEDVTRAILFAVHTSALRGPVNVTAPAPLVNRDFSRAIGRALRRPCWAPAPGFVLKTLLGEMSTLMLTGQKAVPAKLTAAGYAFKYPTADDALREALS